jgi:hypothetical protein
VRLDPRDQGDRFRMQLSGFQRGDGDGEPLSRHQVGDHHVFCAQAAGLHDSPRMFRSGTLQQACRLRQPGFVSACRSRIETDCRGSRLAL